MRRYLPRASSASAAAAPLVPALSYDADTETGRDSAAAEAAISDGDGFLSIDDRDKETDDGSSTVFLVADGSFADGSFAASDDDDDDDDNALSPRPRRSAVSVVLVCAVAVATIFLGLRFAGKLGPSSSSSGGGDAAVGVGVEPTVWGGGSNGTTDGGDEEIFPDGDGSPEVSWSSSSSSSTPPGDAGGDGDAEEAAHEWSGAVRPNEEGGDNGNGDDIGGGERNVETTTTTTAAEEAAATETTAANASFRDAPTAVPTIEASVRDLPTTVTTTEPTFPPSRVPSDEPTTTAPSFPPSDEPTTAAPATTTAPPTLAPAPAPHPSRPLPPLIYAGEGRGAGRLRLCEGDCDDDSDCRGGLVCLQRSSSKESATGCSDVDGIRDGVDYCVEPRSPVLVDTAWGSDLGMCEGDCDNDDDCRGELTCFHRDSLERVPGCDGSGRAGWDFCHLDPAGATEEDHRDRDDDVRFDTFSFYVMGDVPYTLKEERLLPAQLKDMSSSGGGGGDHDPTSSNAAFAIHVGDIFRANRYDCAREQYSFILDIVRDHSDLPLLVIPGDNEWAGECEGPSADTQRRRWSDHFEDVEDHWADESDVPSKVRRQRKRRENFAFVHQGVLFLSINMVKGKEPGYERRLDDNAAWIDEWMGEYFDLRGEGDGDGNGKGRRRSGSARIRAIFVFGHSPFPGSFFTEVLAARYSRLLSSLEAPTFYIHGNGHEYEIERTFADEYKGSGRRWRDYFRMQVDRGGYAPPIRVTVRGETEEALSEPFYEEDEHQSVMGRIVKVDRRGGLYSNR